MGLLVLLLVDLYRAKSAGPTRCTWWRALLLLAAVLDFVTTTCNQLDSLTYALSNSQWQLHHIGDKVRAGDGVGKSPAAQDMSITGRLDGAAHQIP
ncbi:hypothetical protein J3F83DRAFT_95141 [Trichoderma novae-zelandiae]